MKLKNISIRYKKKEILKDVEFDLTKTGLVFIKGDSGIGKTSLLNVIYGLKKDKNKSLDTKEYKQFVRNHVSYIFQDFKVHEHLSVYDNIVMQLEMKGVNVDFDVIDDYLRKFGMIHNRFKKVRVLSGGERQRLAIIRSMILEPSVLLCDEPTGSIDEIKTEEIYDILKEISKTRLVVVVSHNEYVVNKYADRIFTIEDKKLVEVKSRVTNELVISDKEFSAIKFKDLFKLSVKNYKRNFLRVSISFLVFSLLASMFMIIGFIDQTSREYMIDKYSDYPTRDVIHVMFKNKKSVNDLTAFYQTYSFDSYNFTRLYNRSKRAATHFIHSDDLRQYEEVSFVPDFFTEEELQTISDTVVIEMKEYGVRITKPSILFSDWGILTALNDLSVLENNLVYGRMPDNEREYVVNEAFMKRIISRYNAIAEENFKEVKYLSYDEMNEEEVLSFIEDNKVMAKLNSKYNEDYDNELLDQLSFDIVGIVDDYEITFDPYLFDIESDYYSSKGAFNSVIYCTMDYYMLRTKLEMFYIKSIYNPRGKYGFLDPELVLADESLDLDSLKIFTYTSLYKQGMDIYEYVERVRMLENSKDVKKVFVSDILRSYNSDMEEIERVDRQLNSVGAIALTIGFLTAFITMVFTLKKRRSEYFIYHILGLKKIDRFKLYCLEVLYTMMFTMMLTFIFGSVIFILAEELLIILLNSILFNGALSTLSIQVSVPHVLIYLALFIPFIASFIYLDKDVKRYA